MMEASQPVTLELDRNLNKMYFISIYTEESILNHYEIK